jgi:hypothetical protein
MYLIRNIVLSTYAAAKYIRVGFVAELGIMPAVFEKFLTRDVHDSR